jgi:phospholipase C
MRSENDRRGRGGMGAMRLQVFGWWRRCVTGGVAMLAASCCGAAADEARPPQRGLDPIQHIVIIMQENRSFDSYFGTYPGANGIPQGVCVPLNPAKPGQGCTAPFHDPIDINAGGPHSSADAQADLDDGITQAKLDGFVYSQTTGFTKDCSGSPKSRVRNSGNCRAFVPGTNLHDVMGYHTAAELPNYWAYAQNFVLQDSMFEGVRSYSLPAHLDLVSEWSAICTNPLDVSTCVTTTLPAKPSNTKVEYPWVNLFQLLDTHNVSWKYYLASGLEPDCDDDEMTCDPQSQSSGVLSFWNPAPGFAWVEAQGPAYLAAHNPDADQFLLDVKNATLPQVSWVVPSIVFSEHPAASIDAGQDYVTSLVNAIMQSPYWANTAIFVTWDDWGGFYDHVVPPIVDENNSSTPIQGFGQRVPGLLISAYAKPGYIDHGILSTDSYARFIEDTFMDGTRLDRITKVRLFGGNVVTVGFLEDEFDFGQKPLPPLILSTHIPIDIGATCASQDINNPQNCTINAVTVRWRPVNEGYIKGPFTYQLLRDGTPVTGCTPASDKCVDKGVASGTHYYTVYSIDQNNTASPASAAAEAIVP